MDRETLVGLTADIVASHVANNSIAVGDVSKLVETVHGALLGLAEPGERPPEKKTPMVPVRSSVKPDFIACLVCGSKHKMLKRHLQTAHGMTPDQYRSEFGLVVSYPLTAPNYSQQRREIAVALGLGTKRNKGTGGKSKSRKR